MLEPYKMRLAQIKQELKSGNFKAGNKLYPLYKKVEDLMLETFDEDLLLEGRQLMEDIERAQEYRKINDDAMYKEESDDYLGEEGDGFDDLFKNGKKKDDELDRFLRDHGF